MVTFSAPPRKEHSVWLASHAGGVWVPRLGEELCDVRWGVEKGDHVVFVSLAGRPTIKANWSCHKTSCVQECERFRRAWHSYVAPVWVAGSRAGLHLDRRTRLIRAYVRRRKVCRYVLVLQVDGGQHEVGWGSDRRRANEECARVRRIFGLAGEGFPAEGGAGPQPAHPS